MSGNISGLTISALLWLGMVPLHAQTRSTAPKTAPVQGSTPAAAQQPAPKLPSQTPGSARQSAPLALPDLTATSDGIVIGGQRVPWGGSVTLNSRPNVAGGSAGSADKAGNVVFQPSPSAAGVAKQDDLLKQRESKFDSTVRDPAQQLSCRFPYAFTAQNIGGGPLPPSVFYLLSTEDGRGLAGGTSSNARLDPLGPGQQKKVSGEIDLPGGLHILRLALDQTRQVNELNRENNEFQITVNVNCGPPKDKAVTGAMAPSPKSPYMSASRNLVADIGGWEARVKAKGLDPKDPNLKSKLAKLAAQDTQAFAAQHRGSAFRIVPATRPKAPALPSFRQSTSASLAKSVVTAPSPSSTNPGSTANMKSPSSMPLMMPEIHGLAVLDPDLHDAAGRLDAEHFYLLRANWDQLFPARQNGDVYNGAIAAVDLGDCGSVEIHVGVPDGSWARFPELGNDPSTLLLAHLASIPGNHVTSGVLTVRVRSAVSNPLQLAKVIPSRQTATAALGILAIDPHLSGDGGIGLQASHLALAGNGDRVSTAPENQGGHGGSGTDIIGRGIYLMNGYTATARIVSAHSYMDAPNYSQPDDSYRGATIAQQPQSGRLETRVAWHYAAGESIDYVIEWELKGTYGVRPLSTMPRPGTCGD